MEIKYRYLLLLMGFFAFFCGLMYNDFMGIPLKMFNSCYINQIDPLTNTFGNLDGNTVGSFSVSS